MAELDIRSIMLIAVAVAFTVIILYLVLKILFKARRGPSSKKVMKSQVLKAVESDSDSELDSIFNTIVSTKRISTDLKRRGIDTNEADAVVKKAEQEYNQGRESNAKFHIQEAKEMLLLAKKKWDQMTGFDVIPESAISEPKKTFNERQDMMDSQMPLESPGRKPDEVFPELKKAVDKKPDNYLPSKFTISLAQKAVDDATSAGHNTQEAEGMLKRARECFDRNDFDEAFRMALGCKKESEALLGLDSGGSHRDDKGISDLASLDAERENLMVCSICGNKKVAYICIETESGEEATCRDCYEGTMQKTQPKPAMPPPPPPPDYEEKRIRDEGTKEPVLEGEQRFCPNCGAKVKGDDMFCGMCGKPVNEEVKCASCGTKLQPGDMFCRKCGARLVS